MTTQPSQMGIKSSWAQLLLMAWLNCQEDFVSGVTAMGSSLAKPSLVGRRVLSWRHIDHCAQPNAQAHIGDLVFISQHS